MTGVSPVARLTLWSIHPRAGLRPECYPAGLRVAAPTQPRRVGAGQRWIAHLVKDGQVVSSKSGEDVALTGEAIERMRRFLDFASSEAQKAEAYKADR